MPIANDRERGQFSAFVTLAGNQDRGLPLILQKEIQTVDIITNSAFGQLRYKICPASNWRLVRARRTKHALSRHTLLMGARPDKQPWRFKREANRAGSTLFVGPDQVEGALARGFEYYNSLVSTSLEHSPEVAK